MKEFAIFDPRFGFYGSKSSPGTPPYVWKAPVWSISTATTATTTSATTATTTLLLVSFYDRCYDYCGDCDYDECDDDDDYDDDLSIFFGGGLTFLISLGEAGTAMLNLPSLT